MAHFGLTRYPFDLNVVLTDLAALMSFAVIRTFITPHTVGPHGPSELIIKMVFFYKVISHDLGYIDS